MDLLSENPTDDSALSSEQMLMWWTRYKFATSEEDKKHALEVLFNHNRMYLFSIINYVIKKFKVPPYFEDELLSAAREAFFKIINNLYKPDKGTKLTTYAYKYVRLEVIKEVKKLLKNGDELSLDYTYTDGFSLHDVLPENRMDLSELYKQELFEALIKLGRFSEEDLELIDTYYFGRLKVEEIAEDKGISPEKVRSHLNTLTYKLKRYKDLLDLHTLLEH